MRDSTAQEFQFDEFKLDESSYQLRRGDRLLRLEKLPMELLILLVQRRGELVSRDDIAERLWGKGVFVDVDHSINVAVRKIRVALRDDPEKPRFVETVVGKGYRFAAPVVFRNGDDPAKALPSAVPAVSSPLVLPTADPRRKGRAVPARMLLAGFAVLAFLGLCPSDTTAPLSPLWANFPFRTGAPTENLLLAKFGSNRETSGSASAPRPR